MIANVVACIECKEEQNKIHGAGLNIRDSLFLMISAYVYYRKSIRIERIAFINKESIRYDNLVSFLFQYL